MELTIRQLTKTYPSGVKALEGLDVCLSAGVHGILGPNGAGKSTLLQILTGNLRPSGGDVLWNGQSIFTHPEAYRRCLGYMPQQQALYPGFTAAEYLCYFGALRKMDRSTLARRIDEVLARVELQEAAHQKIAGFSGGMKQRLLLAQAVLAKPQVLLLDEPTAGLDPHQRIALRNLIAELSADCVVLLATHIVSDIEVVARDILLLKKGKLVAFDTPGRLCGRLQGKVYEVQLPGAKPPDSFAVSGLRQRIDGSYAARILAEQPPAGYPCRLADPTLEDVFLYEMGEWG